MSEMCSPDKVDQTVPDQRHVLGLVDEKLPHRDRRGGPLAQETEVLRILGG